MAGDNDPIPATLDELRARVKALEAKLEEAKENGDDGRTRKLEAALESVVARLAAVEAAAAAAPSRKIGGTEPAGDVTGGGDYWGW